MKVTVRELIQLNLWDKYCDDTGMNIWAVNEGLIDKDVELEWLLKD